MACQAASVMRIGATAVSAAMVPLLSLSNTASYFCSGLARCQVIRRRLKRFKTKVPDCLRFRLGQKADARDRKVHPVIALLHGRVVIGVARIDRLAACEAFALPVVEANAVFAKFPAEVDLFPIDSGGKIKQSDFQILDNAAS